MTVSEQTLNHQVDCRGMPLIKGPDEIGISASGIIYDRLDTYFFKNELT